MLPSLQYFVWQPELTDSEQDTQLLYPVLWSPHSVRRHTKANQQDHLSDKCLMKQGTGVQWGWNWSNTITEMGHGCSCSANDF